MGHQGLTGTVDSARDAIPMYRPPELEFIGTLEDITQIGNGNGFEGSFGYSRNCKGPMNGGSCSI